MAASQMTLPKGFILDRQNDPNIIGSELPNGFILDRKLAEPNKSEAELIESLQGSLPLSQAPKAHQIPSAAFEHPLNVQREQAYKQLIESGKTLEQIKLILDINRNVGRPPTFGRTLGSIAGSLAAPAALNLIPPFAALPEEVATVPMALAKGIKMVMPYLGAGTGGGLGELTQIASQEKRLLSKEEFLKAFGKEVGYEFGGRAFVRGAKAAFSPFIQRRVPEAANIIDEYRAVGGVLPPAQLDKRFTISVAEEIGRGSFGAKQIYQELEEKSGAAARVYADLLLDRMAQGANRLSAREIGDILSGDIMENGRILKMMDDLFEPLYKQIDELTKARYIKLVGDVPMTSKILDETGKPIEIMTKKIIGDAVTGVGASTKPLKRFAFEQLAIDARPMKVGKKGFHLTSEGRNLLDTIKNLKDTISFSDMRLYRTRALEASRRLARDLDSSKTMSKRLAKLANQSLFDAENAPKLTKEARLLLKNTNRLYAAAEEGLKNTFSEKLANRLVTNPSAVIKEVFPQKNAKAIELMRKSLTEPISGMPSEEGKQLWTQLRTAWFADTVENSMREGVVKPHLFESSLRRMGKEAIDEMIPDATGKRQLQNIRDLLKAMTRRPIGGASLFIRSGQVYGAYKMYDSGKEGDFLGITAGGALVLGPRMFAKLSAHKLGSRLITAGIKIKPGSTSLVPITARLINLARQMDAQEISIKMRKQRRAARIKHTALESKIVPLRPVGGHHF